MPSWKIPELVNKLSDEIPAIKGLITALLKWTDSGTTDVPVGAKRLQSVSSGVQLQEYSGSAWTSIGRLMHDVDKVDGKHADAGTTADTIPVRDANGKIPGNITGNAPTASVASGLASNYVVPIAKGGTGASDVVNARISLGLNNASNMNSGVLDTAHGGTGRTDGMVTDVHLADYNVSAKGTGQLGHAAQKNGISANSLVLPGVSFCTGCTLALGYPSTEDCFIRTQASLAVRKTVNNVPVVYTYVSQSLTEVSGDKKYRRDSLDGGTTWSAWMQSETCGTQDVHVYVSKGGNDANTGFANNDAVLTLNALYDILLSTKTLGAFVCHFGPGEWGDLEINGDLLQGKSIRITNYPDTQATATPIVAEGETVPEGTYFEDLTESGNFGNEPPHFSSISLSNAEASFGNVSVDLAFFENTVLSAAGAVSFCSLSAFSSHVSLGSHIVHKDNSVTDPVFDLDDSHLGIACGDGLCKVLNEPLNTQFLKCKHRCSVKIGNTVDWNGVYAGQKFLFETPVFVYGTVTPDALPGSAGEGSWLVNGTLHIQNGTDAVGNIYETFESVGNDTVATAYLEAKYAGLSDSAIIGVVHKSDGTKYAFAPTPPNGDSSDKIATTEWISVNSFPAGTRMFFQQTSAPSGWTKETGAAYNNVALRLTTGNIANKTDGSTFTTWMVAGRTTSDTTQGGSTGNGTNTGSIGNKALSVAMLAKHTHTFPGYNGSGSGGAKYLARNQSGKSGTLATKSTGSGSNHNHGWTGTSHNHTFTGTAHNHKIDLDINYIDFIVATKA